MSAKLMAWALEQDIPPVPRLVLVAICDVISDDPSYRTMKGGQKWLAKKLCMSERSIRGHLDTLEKDGWIRREKRKQQGGEFSTDEVHVIHQRQEVADGKKTSSPAARNGSDQRQEVAAKTITRPLDRPLENTRVREEDDFERQKEAVGLKDFPTENDRKLITRIMEEAKVTEDVDAFAAHFAASAVERRRMITSLPNALRAWVYGSARFAKARASPPKAPWEIEDEARKRRIQEALDGLVE